MVNLKYVKLRLLMMVLVALVAVVSTAAADDKDYMNYGRVGLGGHKSTEDLDGADYDAGGSVGFAYGRYLNKHLILEGGVNYFHSGEDSSGNTVTAGDYDREDDLNVSAVLVTLKGELPLGPLRLFAGAGVGGYLAYLTSEIETQNLGDFDADDTDLVFGAHIVAGGTYDITPRIFAGIEGMYRWTDDVNLSETVGTVPVTYKGNLNGYSIYLTGGFRF